MKKSILLTDVDGVCLSWVSGFAMYASRVLNRNISGQPSTYDMTEWLGLKTYDEVEKYITLFNEGEWEFGCLPEMANSVNNLQKIHNSNVDIIAITCCSIDKATKSLRHANLFHTFGPIFKEIVFLPLGTSKINELEKFKDRNVIGWVEDKVSAAYEGKELGYDTFLIKSEYSKKHELENPRDLQYVNTWDEITPKILNKLN